MLKTNDKVLFQKLGNEAVFLHLDSEEYFGLDEIGTRFYEVLVAKGNSETALPILAEEYDVDTDTLQKDLKDLIISLKKENILFEE